MAAEPDGAASLAATVEVDRKTVRRSLDAGIEAGLVREGSDGQLTDALLGAAIELVRPERPAGHGGRGRRAGPSTSGSRRG